MRTDLFASPLFVASVVLLLVNDWILKLAFQNWLTGKLSDFSGLAAVTLFGCALAPRYRWLVAWFVSTAFLYWKSPYSQSFIDLLNQASPVLIRRTVDYSDLIALPAVWLVSAFALRMRALVNRAWLQQAFAVVSVVAFTATSTIYTHESREVANLSARSDPRISQDDLQKLIDAIAGRHGLECSICESLFEGRLYGTHGSREFLFVARFEPESNHLLYEIASSAARRDEVRRKDVDLLRDDLVRELRARYPSLTIDTAIRPRPVMIRLVVYKRKEVSVRSYRDAENWRDHEKAKELVKESALQLGMAADGYSEFYYLGGLVGPSHRSRELTVLIWAADSPLTGIDITRNSERVAETQKRIVSDIRERLQREFGAKRIAVR
jgi:hypothetical protein